MSIAISKKRIITIGFLSVSLTVILLSIYLVSNAPVKIHTDEISQAGNSGVVRSSSTTPPTKDKLQATNSDTVSYESNIIDITAKSNAAVIEWDQTGDSGVEMEVRTNNGSNWTPWTEADEVDGGRDDVAAQRSSTLILANNIDEIQYRFNLSSNATESSALININNTKIQTIDSSQGPTGEPSLIQKFANVLHISDRVAAKADGPRIISRSEWGSPEPDYSSWTPEYQPLGRAIVHHTATTEAPNAFVAIRAIWQYHAVNQGWGDIGYNYLVDSAGNIFQGRYFDKNYASTRNVDVVGGHAYGNNQGTTGIAAIGDFEANRSPTAVQINAISDIIGYKLSPYDANPNGNGSFGTTVVGHRDVLSTACPGRNLYSRLNDIRSAGSNYYMKYSAEHKLDYGFHGQALLKNNIAIPANTTLYQNESAKIVFDLKNNGTEPWTNSGQFATLIGTSGPSDRSSRFYDPATWKSTNRVGSFASKVDPDTGIESATTIVLPGEIGRFVINLNIPDIASDSSGIELFEERFRLVQDGRMWFPRDIGLFYPLTVDRHTYEWSHVSQSIFTDSSKSQTAPTILTPGNRYFVQLGIKNSGTGVWHRNNFKIGTSQPQDRTSLIYDSTWLAQNRPTSLTQQSVAPGETGSFEFWIKIPSSPINRKEYFRPVVDGVQWLNDIGQYWQITAQ